MVDYAIVMLCLNTYDVVERILKRLKVRAWCLLRFDEGKTFNASSSALDPQDFIGIVDGLKGFSFEFLGGFTNRGVHKFVNAYANVKGRSLVPIDINVVDGKRIREKTGRRNRHHRRRKSRRKRQHL